MTGRLQNKIRAYDTKKILTKTVEFGGFLDQNESKSDFGEDFFFFHGQPNISSKEMFRQDNEKDELQQISYMCIKNEDIYPYQNQMFWKHLLHHFISLLKKFP